MIVTTVVYVITCAVPAGLNTDIGRTPLFTVPDQNSDVTAAAAVGFADMSIREHSAVAALRNTG